MKLKIGQLTFSVEKIAEDKTVDAETNVTIGAFNAWSFYNATCKAELIGLMVATGLVQNREHARRWINGKYGGYGDFDKAKRRASGWYRNKYNIAA